MSIAAMRWIARGTVIAVPGGRSGPDMPYPSNDDLPPSVRNHLPEHAQDIYREAFNHAWTRYGGDESVPHRIAWAAVKRSYRKAGDTWVPRGLFDED
jgi:cation transport regulator